MKYIYVYGAGHLLSDHVAVVIDGNVKRFKREGLRQLQCCIVTDEDLCGRNVLHYHLFQLLHNRSTSAPPPTYAIAMSLYQIMFMCI